MKNICTKQELYSLPVKGIVENSTSVMFLDINNQFYMYTRLLPYDKYINVDFLVWCKQNKIKLY